MSKIHVEGMKWPRIGWNLFFIRPIRHIRVLFSEVFA